MKTAILPTSKSAWATAFIMVMLVAALALVGCQNGQQQGHSEGASFDIAPDEYVLILGDDAWGEFTPGRSDLMLLMRMDAENKQLYLVSIPRDTEYLFEGETKIKANHAYYYRGVEGALTAASEITGVDVTQYVVVNFEGLQKIVDYFGGIDMNLPYPVDYFFYTKDYPNEVFESGEQTLTPWRAMAISRARTSYSSYDLSEDMMRQIIDRQMFTNLASAALSDPRGIEIVIEELFGSIETNVPKERLITWAMQYASFDSFTVYGTSGPVDGGIDPDTKEWLIPYDEDKWSVLMDVVISGGDPASVDVQFADNVQSEIAPINSTIIIQSKDKTS